MHRTKLVPRRQGFMASALQTQGVTLKGARRPSFLTMARSVCQGLVPYTGATVACPLVKLKLCSCSRTCSGSQSPALAERDHVCVIPSPYIPFTHISYVPCSCPERSG